MSRRDARDSFAFSPTQRVSEVALGGRSGSYITVIREERVTCKRNYFICAAFVAFSAYEIIENFRSLGQINGGK